MEDYRIDILRRILGTADSIGWLFKRLQDFFFLCERRNNFHNYFSLYDLNYIRESVEIQHKVRFLRSILKTD